MKEAAASEAVGNLNLPTLVVYDFRRVNVCRDRKAVSGKGENTVGDNPELMHDMLCKLLSTLS